MALSQEACEDIVRGLNHACWTLTGTQLKTLQGPYVYQLIRDPNTETSRTLYVGVKTGEDARPFNPNHHRLGNNGHDDDVCWTDQLVIYPMPSAEVAMWAEAMMISMLTPEWNRRRPLVPLVPDVESPALPEHAGVIEDAGWA